MSYETRLKNVGFDYREAEEKEIIPRLAAGKRYEVTVTKSEVVIPDGWNDLQWRVVFKNDEGEHVEHVNLERENLAWKIKQYAKALGFTGDLHELERWAPVAVGATCFIDTAARENKNNPDKPYVNATIVKLLSPGKGEPLKEAPAPAVQSDLDDIPF